jgi:hypothetical protein
MQPVTEDAAAVWRLGAIAEKLRYNRNALGLVTGIKAAVAARVMPTVHHTQTRTPMPRNSLADMRTGPRGEHLLGVPSPAARNRKLHVEAAIVAARVQPHVRRHRRRHVRIRSAGKCLPAP